MSGPYKLPQHAIRFFGSKADGQWGLVPWYRSKRENGRNPDTGKFDLKFRGCQEGHLQSFQKLGGGGFDAVFWQSECFVDNDGPSPTYTAAQLKAIDECHQNETTLHWEKPWKDADGKLTAACDSRGFFGIVCPPQFRKLFGISPGDFALVCHGGVIRGAQYYDTGNTWELGEYSQGLVGALGLPNDPNKGNNANDICTLAFPGSGLHVATGQTDQLITALEQFAQFTRGGGRNA